MDQNIYTVFITAISVLGGTAAWRFYEKRAMHREKDEDFIRTDCKERISKLETLLKASSREKDELRDLVLNLTKEVAELRVKIEFFFLIQKIEQKLPEKNTPSTIAKAKSLIAKDSFDSIHLTAHPAFSAMHGNSLTALNNLSFSSGSLTILSICKLYVSL